MPLRRATLPGFVAVVLILFVVTPDGNVEHAVTGLDESYEAAQELFQDTPPRPGTPRMTGSAGSLIDLAAIGKPGRDFYVSGPTAEDIAAFTGQRRRWVRSSSMSGAPVASRGRRGPN
ncbi:alpha/beta-hydrolase N-terminal domain-containing protein [Jannaschia seohaensis]|uniref:Alpha/beta hydrolase family protein n=1 Tax=Jannaschia seohaensis TaxID=475081 RepID=A0A2Y9AQN3_9RHOB|nr:alpha/beta-hydrolase N-terminal domain-containing protein [Jannaschia seohaensis]PWJ20563.1 alpha/beta hydrolase family protein [Jannaschia seohaensis]SSA44659.1 Alpha/beta-hydrolase family N-terminus [Jannaschia seohaensis]